MRSKMLAWRIAFAVLFAADIYALILNRSSPGLLAFDSVCAAVATVGFILARSAREVTP